MTVIKQAGGVYIVDLRPLGTKGRRIRKKFTTRAEALRYERHILATAHDKAWMDKPADRRPLTELIDQWWKYHGQTLKSGEGNKSKLLLMAEDMGWPLIYQVSRKSFAEYRAMRMANGVKASTINRTQALLSGVFTTLIKSGHYLAEHPLSGMPRLKTVTQEMSYLNQAEIDALLLALAGERDSLNAVRLSLATGARWGEAAGMTRNGLSKYKVTFNNTKNGKNRSVPISESLYRVIADSSKRLLFPDADYVRVRTLLKSIAPDLPAGQAVHVLRHTFASHFMMNGGNILTLQKILGHSTINQTMIYAHFSPDYLIDAVRFNPLCGNEFE